MIKILSKEPRISKIDDISLHHYSMCAIPLSCEHYIQCMYMKVLHLQKDKVQD